MQLSLDIAFIHLVLLNICLSENYPMIILQTVSKACGNIWSDIDAKIKYAEYFKQKDKLFWNQLSHANLMRMDFSWYYLLRTNEILCIFFRFHQTPQSESDNLLSINKNIMIVKYLSQTNQIISYISFNRQITDSITSCCQAER